MSKKLYVGNLSYSTSEETLRTLFSEFGQVQSVNMITDRETGRTKGFAFVEMAEDQAAQKAISSLAGKSLDDRQINVAEARPQAERSGDRSGGGRRRSSW